MKSWREEIIMIIEIDGKKVFSVCDGEPEDSNLSRDLMIVGRSLL